MKYNSAEVKELWRRFICDWDQDEGSRGKYDTIIRGKMFETFDHLSIRLMDILNFDEELFYYIIRNPIKHIRIIRKIVMGRIKEWLLVNEIPEHHSPEPYVYLDNSGKTRVSMIKTTIPKIWKLKQCQLLSFQGTIKQIHKVGNRAHKIAYQCGRCQEIFPIKQEYLRKIKPLECPGCKRAAASSFFTEVPEMTISWMTQMITIEEHLDKVKTGCQPDHIYCWLDGNLCGSLQPGNKVRVVGTLNTSPPQRGGRKPIYEYYFRILGFEVLERKFTDMKILPNEVEEIHKIAKKENVIEYLTNQISPSIFGYSELKQAILLQLFGSPRKFRQSGEAFRGDIHVLILGDPSTAKSQILNYVSELMPRGLYASGRGSSAAGLSASVERDEMSGKWLLVGGALVMANDGIVCLDEIDKMRQSGISSLLEGMSKQTVTIDKASIHATLQSQCSILAAGNPKQGRFVDRMEYYDQINIPTELLSRFDLVFLLRDIADKTKDEALADHILDYWDHEEIEELDRDIFVKYIAYGKRLTPKIPKILKEKLKMYYVSIRQQYLQYSTIPIDARHLQGLERISCASARARLSEEVIESDIDRALIMLTDCIRSFNPAGILDVDVLETGISMGTRAMEDKFRLIFARLVALDEGREGVSVHDIYSEMEEGGISQNKTDVIIKKMVKGKEIYELFEGRYMKI